MLSILDKISKALDWVSLRICAVLLVVISASIFLQVFCRYVLNNALPWPEELSRFCFIWLSMLGLASLVSNGGHIAITSFTDMLSKNRPIVKKAVGTFVDVIAAYCAYFLLRYGVLVVDLGSKQHSPALNLSMAPVYMAAPIAGTIILIHVLRNVCHRFFKDGSTET